MTRTRQQEQERPSAIVAFFSGGIAGVIEIVITCTYIFLPFTHSIEFSQFPAQTRSNSSNPRYNWNKRNMVVNYGNSKIL